MMPLKRQEIFFSSDPAVPPLSMVYVEGGIFTMGSEKYNDEKPRHKVSLSSFWISQFLVTQEQWVALMGDNPARFQGKHRPVERVSWADICGAGGFLSRLRQKTGQGFRLPREAEWEYAAAGGKVGFPSGFGYAGGDILHEVGWYGENSHEETKPVGLKLPNALGLYDMSGNVWEWCYDVYAAAAYAHFEGLASQPVSDPVVSSRGADSSDLAGATVLCVDGPDQVLRGGSWFNIAINCRVAPRIYLDPASRNDIIGFRLVLP